MQLQQGFAAGEMGSEVMLRGSNPESLMSALGRYCRKTILTPGAKKNFAELRPYREF
jgi:hypothetical protein